VSAGAIGPRRSWPILGRIVRCVSRGAWSVERTSAKKAATLRSMTSPRNPFDASWLDAGPDRARALVDEAGDRSGDLVAAWIANKNAAAVATIAADDSAPTPARKAARRGINVLKSRGVAIPDRPRIARVAAADVDIFEAWFRPPDASGSSAFTMGVRSPQGRYRLVDVILKRGTGLVSVADMEMSRSQLRTTFDGIAARFGHPPAPVPVEWARARIAAARADNDRNKTIVPMGFETHRDLVGPPPGTVPAHPADGLALESVDPSEAVARSAKLHAEPEFRGWLPDPPAMQEMLLAIQGQVAPGAGADQAKTESMVATIVTGATDRFFTADVRRDIADAMKDAVISLAERGARDRAADALAVAALVRSSDTASSAIPFLLAFFEKAFGLAVARAARKSAG